MAPSSSVLAPPALAKIAVATPAKGWSDLRKADVAAALVARLPHLAVRQAAFMPKQAIFAIKASDAEVTSAAASPIVLDGESLVLSTNVQPKAERIKLVNLPLGFTIDDVKSAVSKHLNAKVRHVAPDQLRGRDNKPTGIWLTSCAVFLDPGSKPIRYLPILGQHAVVLDNRLPRRAASCRHHHHRLCRCHWRRRLRLLFLFC